MSTRLPVIDKLEPTGEAPGLADAKAVGDLFSALEVIRNGRSQPAFTARERQSADPGDPAQLVC